MSAQHTPGPWRAHKIEKSQGLAYTPVAAKTLLAKVYSEAFGDYAQSEANARLIAASPELLAACREARIRLIGVAGMERITSTLDDAIFKATGSRA